MSKQPSTLTLSGNLFFRSSGHASLYLSEDTGPFLKDESIDIDARDTGLALHKDTVTVEAKKRSRPRPPRRNQKASIHNQYEFRVICVDQRASEVIVGTLRQKKDYYYVQPADPRIPLELIIDEMAPPHIDPAPQENDKVAVKILEWDDPDFFPSAHIVKNFGATHAPGPEFQAILYQYDLNPDFPLPVEKELESIPDRVSAEEIGNRLDYRKIFTYTIDPVDAKDFDDAISVEYLEGGKTQVGVHIADVNAYVKKGSALDVEAQKRGNSTYLVGTVIPMLPHKLSSGVCSLKEAEDRLTKSAFFVFDQEHNIERTWFANTVICSRKRLTYEQALCFLHEDSLDTIQNAEPPPAHLTGFSGRPLQQLDHSELAEIQKATRILWDIAKKLREERMRAGSLDLDMPEVKIYVDEEGWADRIEKQSTDESHQLIEEFMLCANEAVAAAFKRKGLAAVHRVHEKPDPEKLQELGETIRSMGLSIGDLTDKREVSKFLQLIKTHPQGYTLKVAFLRSLRQARYSDEALGHYGLNKSNYLHFTSPIRRYADLIVHRIFDIYLKNTKNDTASSQRLPHYKKEQLTSLGDHISITERNSVDAERDSVKEKLLEYYDRETRLPEKVVHQAIITDVKGRGLFVEMADTLAYGFVPYTSFKDDHYSISPDGVSIIGKRRHKEYAIGQLIPVTVAKVDRFKRQMDLNFFGPSQGGQGPRLPQPGKKKSSSRGRGGSKQTSKSKSGNKSKRSTSSRKRGGKKR